MDEIHHPNKPQASYVDAAGTVHSGASAGAKKSKMMKPNSVGVLTAVLLVGIIVIIFLVIWYALYNSGNDQQSSYVNTSEYQAVFVNVTGSSGGQAYFGHITKINNNYIALSNVFYLEPGSTSNQFTLNNLSCALYNPSDTMLISQDQVAFWENLKSNSQVTTDINKWNTDKLACPTNSSSATNPTSTTGTVPTK